MFIFYWNNFSDRILIIRNCYACIHFSVPNVMVLWSSNFSIFRWTHTKKKNKLKRLFLRNFENYETIKTIKTKSKNLKCSEYIFRYMSWICCNNELSIYKRYTKKNFINVVDYFILLFYNTIAQYFPINKRIKKKCLQLTNFNNIYIISNAL